MRKPNLILGTAQFGFNYGITNKNGKVSLDEAKKILNFCKKNNIYGLDTAHTYGDSEKTIGLSLPKKHQFKIFSKTKKIEDPFIGKKDIQIFEENLHTSCKNLGSDKIHGLLIHSIKDLKTEITCIT